MPKRADLHELNSKWEVEESLDTLWALGRVQRPNCITGTPVWDTDWNIQYKAVDTLPVPIPELHNFKYRRI